MFFFLLFLDFLLVWLVGWDKISWDDCTKLSFCTVFMACFTTILHFLSSIYRRIFRTRSQSGSSSSYFSHESFKYAQNIFLVQGRANQLMNWYNEHFYVFYQVNMQTLQNILWCHRMWYDTYIHYRSELLNLKRKYSRQDWLLIDSTGEEEQETIIGIMERTDSQLNCY